MVVIVVGVEAAMVVIGDGAGARTQEISRFGNEACEP